MEGTESVLESIFDDEERADGREEGEILTLGDGDEDVEMVDAEPLDADDDAGSPARVSGGGATAAEGGSQGHNQSRRASKKKKKKRKPKRKIDSAPTITDINRFVLDTCRRLKEKKSYLVWNAVGCLGVAAFSDLVKEVDAIQGCGGQRTADEKRFRTGGGILWNILKAREPKAYKEIMAKGKEFERQLWQPKKKQRTNENEIEAPQNRHVPDEAAGGEVVSGTESGLEMQQGVEQPDSSKRRVSVRDRIRVPVSYDDLFEEGEIQESA